MGRGSEGKIGCGCLLFVLIVVMVFAGLMMHPFSLKLIAGRFQYGDKILPSDAIYVPRFVEDKNGEVYAEAFREYWAGNGKVIWIEDDRVFGFSLKDVVGRMAKERGIKEGAVNALDVEGDDVEKAGKVKEALAKQGIRKAVLVVPDYASRRYHLLYGSSDSEGAILFFVKPVSVSYFKTDKWWKNDVSRAMMAREFYRTGLFYANRFKYGGKEDGRKE